MVVLDVPFVSAVVIAVCFFLAIADMLLHWAIYPRYFYNKETK